ncbi:hypothetical protein UFOVP1106_26 [uncultured Caudovirales phage]|uniref:Uncharacterized protein n=1 Tax=uncultured Caudovirales phage TaxID=2100421 RepID=A0A6J5QIQ8_9CAUD|nr:hypothetical protein UFOVP1106_26 [uncultured Caudovirales phage]
MNIKDELIRYAKWYDKATMPEDAQTDEADLVQNVESYLQTEGKNIVLSDVIGEFYCWEKDCNLPKCETPCNVCKGSKIKPN